MSNFYKLGSGRVELKAPGVVKPVTEAAAKVKGLVGDVKFGWWVRRGLERLFYKHGLR